MSGWIVPVYRECTALVWRRTMLQLEIARVLEPRLGQLRDVPCGDENVEVCTGNNYTTPGRTAQRRAGYVPCGATPNCARYQRCPRTARGSMTAISSTTKRTGGCEKRPALSCGMLLRQLSAQPLHSIPGSVPRRTFAEIVGVADPRVQSSVRYAVVRCGCLDVRP